MAVSFQRRLLEKPFNGSLYHARGRSPFQSFVLVRIVIVSSGVYFIARRHGDRILYPDCRSSVDKFDKMVTALDSSDSASATIRASPRNETNIGRLPRFPDQPGHQHYCKTKESVRSPW